MKPGDTESIIAIVVILILIAAFAVFLILRQKREEEEARKRQEEEARKKKSAIKHLLNPSADMIRLDKKRDRLEERFHPNHWTDLDYDVVFRWKDENGDWLEFNLGSTEVRASIIDPEYYSADYEPDISCLDALGVDDAYKSEALINWWRRVDERLHLGTLYTLDEIMNDERRTQEERRKNAEAQREILARMPKCPLCGSTNIGPIGAVERGLSVGFLGLASPTIGKSYECRSCHYRW